MSYLTIDGQPVDLSGLAEVCRRYGLMELSVFGTVARGDATASSDVDLLFMLDPDAAGADVRSPG